ncbi:type VII secretion protein EccE [Mycobacterium conspicuum]|uniref:Type VII secretion protein EccE n=1 Tax=Mycobacterium conspicuum TaxID=44010 RepID=A0A1X1TLG9_9MYCO|nr:type VII secretion protein EccE [Mycobacterium conspicuum]ORV45373.1 type VII secretion protein EccE [Mycobacterium conspicuum]BBZ37039.1 type VII secretion protein EccE [Mycobacterium conspicuum]
MSRTVPVPGAGRITLALLAVVPAVMAYPWRTPREQWVLGVAVAVVIVLFGWWGGLHFTTILRRRLAMMRRPSHQAGSPARTTALLRLGPPTGDQGVLPLPLIAGYLDRYGIRADRVRITSRTNPASTSAPRQTWIALTVSAADNLPALRARSSAIPMHETTRVAVRRLADHLREVGWEATVSEPDVVPRLLDSAGRESWRAVQAGSGYLAAYRVSADDALPQTLDAIASLQAREAWVALEIAEGTVAVACALLTDAPPSAAAPLAGLTAQRGNQRPALAALDLLSTERLDGHTAASDDLLKRLDWPCPVAGAHRAPLAEAGT